MESVVLVGAALAAGPSEAAGCLALTWISDLRDNSV